MNSAASPPNSSASPASPRAAPSNDTAHPGGLAPRHPHPPPCLSRPVDVRRRHQARHRRNHPRQPRHPAHPRHLRRTGRRRTHRTPRSSPLRQARILLPGDAVDTRPRLLDLFCGAGGAAMGYHRAGFDVTGVDITDQPRYPFEFIQADAMTFALDGFDAIHASPPCQDHSALSAAAGKHGTGWMLPATLARLAQAGVPWIVENVAGAGDVMAGSVVLCGTEFGLSATVAGRRVWL